LTEVLVISDTHVNSLQELPQSLLQALGDAEWVVHCGDYTSLTVVDELRDLGPNFVGVYGNTDPEEVRQQLPAEVTLTFEGRRVVVVHPYWAGDPEGLEERLAARYPGVDAILFGHTHKPCNLMLNGTLLLNPGQGYPFFIWPASIGILKLSEKEIQGDILTLD